MTYTSPTWVDVAPGTTPPAGAVALDATNLQALTDEVARLGGVVSAVAALTPTVVKSANYTLAVNDLVPFDLTAASRVGTLPTAPADKSQVLAYIHGFGAGHTLTLTAGGSDHIEQSDGSAGTTVVRSIGSGESIWLQYDRTNALWRQLPDRIPISALDARYAPLASPAFTGNPTAPTPTAGDSDTSIATTAFVANAITGTVIGRLTYDKTGVAGASAAFQALYDAGVRDITVPEGEFKGDASIFLDSTGVEKCTIRAYGVRFQSTTGLATSVEFDAYCTSKSRATGCKFLFFNNTKRAALSGGAVTSANNYPTPSYNSRIPPNPRLTIEGGEFSGINITNYNAGMVFGNRGGSTVLNGTTLASARTLVSWTDYTDHGATLKDCSGWGVANMDATYDAFLLYQIASGDGISVQNCKTDNFVGVAHQTSCNGALISGTVGGFYRWESCHGIVVIGSHIEQASNIGVTNRIIYDVQDSDVTIMGAFDYMSESVSSVGALRLNDSGGEGKHSSVEIINWNARHWMAASDPSLGYAIYIEKMAPGSKIVVRSSQHTMSAVGTFATTYAQQGLSISGNATNESTLAAAVSAGCDLIGSGNFEIVKYGTSIVSTGQNSPIPIQIRNIGNLGGTQATRVHTKPTFFDAESYGTGTLANSTAYAYAAAVCNTLPNGTIQYGAATAEWLQTSPGSGGALGFEMYAPTAASGATLVIWRKTGTGVLASPDRYVVIPIGSARTRFLDTGANINKVAWITSSVPVPNTVAGSNTTTSAFYQDGVVVGGGVAVSDEGSSLTAAAGSMNFVGGGVTATASGNAVTVTVPSGGGTNPTDPTAPAWFDDFLGGNITLGQLGELGWAFQGGATPTWLAPVASHPGIVTISSGTVNTNFSTLYLSMGGTANRIFALADNWDVTFWVRPQQTDTDTIMRIGLVANAGSTGADGAYFEKLAADSNWFMVTKGTGSTRVDTTTAVAANTWYKMRVRRVNSTTIGFTLNGGTEVTSTATPPTLPLIPYVNVMTATTTAKLIDVDACQIALTGLSR